MTRYYLKRREITEKATYDNQRTAGKILTQRALNEAVALIAWSTQALRTMIDNTAVSIGPAVARVFALLVDAGEPRWALLVDHAVRALTSNVWVAL